MEWLETKYLYLLLNIFTISIPFWRSFEKKYIDYIGKWGPLFKAISITGSFFIIWDVIFTINGVWGFNPDYLVGLDILHLPIEEWLFFITIPYACLFIYEVQKRFVKEDYLALMGKPFSLLLGLILVASAIGNHEKAYTFWNFLFCGGFLLLHYFIIRPNYLGRFYFSFAIAMLGFFFVNGILTGTGIAEPVVWYNNDENLGIRLGTIPVEDIFYGMLLILMNLTFYEYFKAKQKG